MNVHFGYLMASVVLVAASVCGMILFAAAAPFLFPMSFLVVSTVIGLVFVLALVRTETIRGSGNMQKEYAYVK